MALNIIQKYMTNNDCYKAGRKITVKGLMLHSTATPGIMAADWYSRWNKPGIAKCVHAFLDDQECYQYLPWNHRGWHGGGSSNDTHIGIELCEPKDLNDEEFFKNIWANAVELFAMLCKQYNLTENDIISHYEGYHRGIASNHGDPTHWFPKHGKDMDAFRAEVGKKLKEGIVDEPEPEPEPPTMPKENLVVDGYLGPKTISALQRYFGTPVDGYISKPSLVVKALQKWLGVKEDGYLGPITISALQKRLGTPIDGVISKPSLVVMELQRRLNKGQLD